EGDAGQIRTLTVAEQVAVRRALQDTDRETTLIREHCGGDPPAREKVPDGALADLVVLAKRKLHDRRDHDAMRRVEDTEAVVDERIEAHPVVSVEARHPGLAFGQARGGV